MNIEEQIAANYHPDHDMLTSESVSFAIQDLLDGTMTMNIPKNCDGTISVKVAAGKVSIRFNADFLDKYETLCD